jgi:hypothetical protein
MSPLPRLRGPAGEPLSIEELGEVIRKQQSRVLAKIATRTLRIAALQAEVDELRGQLVSLSDELTVAWVEQGADFGQELAS